MKIVTISAYYPPYSYGGYENRVRDVTDGLSARGHQVYVLTTQPDKTMQVEPIVFDYPVIRKLHGTRRVMSWADRLTMKKSTNRLGVAIVFLRQIWWDMRDLRLIDKAIRKFQPDVIYLGHILPLSDNLLPFLATSPVKLVQDDGGKTLEWSYEKRGLWFRFLSEVQPGSCFLNAMKKAFVSIVTALSAGRIKKIWTWPERINVFFNNHVCYQSFLSTQIPHARSAVIHSGLDTDVFTIRRTRNLSLPLRIILPGRIEPNKGQMDAVNLSAQLLGKGIDNSLTIAGDPWKEDYLELLEKEVSDRGLGSRVRILPAVSKSELIDLYHQSDICFFPSYHDTGFSRIPLEAMACGCLVIAYGKEGSNETIRNNENGFIVESGNVSQVVKLIQRLASNPDEMDQITKAARHEIEKNYSMTNYIDQIESLLKW